MSSAPPSSPEPTGSLRQALAHAERLLGLDPRSAAAQALAILEAAPGHPQARLTLARARRLDGRLREARDDLDALARDQPRSAATRDELALARLALGDEAGALEAWTAAVRLAPDRVSAWRGLAALHAAREETALAEQAQAQALRASATDPELLHAGLALCEGRLGVAEHTLRARLRRDPDDAAALRMLAETAARLARHDDAVTLLEHALAVHPGFEGARATLAQVLHRANRSSRALEEVDRLLTAAPDRPDWLVLKAAVLVRLGRYAEAAGLYARLLSLRPGQPKIWMSYGHALKTLGRQAEAVDAYRQAIARQSTLGEAWWSLANLKTYRFSTADVAAMREGLAAPRADDDDQMHLRFALGKALEDAGEDAAAFENYAEANALRRAQLRYDPQETTDAVTRTQAVVSAGFFLERAHGGCPARDPIFVLGLPRSGSTLVEQILASHSQVEGTMELPDIGEIASRLGGERRRGQRGAYPEALASLSVEQRTGLGEEYLARTRVQRRTDRPFFIDKMPNNWLHLALIRLILPNAVIVDARRHPLGCGWSVFKQHFARGQAFSYGLEDVGRYYRDYERLMAHMDAAAPGAMHRVFYERMVADTEGEVRRLLDHAGLPFEPACLEYWKTERAVRTASSEQVRQPIFSGGVEQWRRFEPWLGEMKTALGTALADYPTQGALAL